MNSHELNFQQWFFRKAQPWLTAKRGRYAALARHLEVSRQTILRWFRRRQPVPGWACPFQWDVESRKRSAIEESRIAGCASAAVAACSQDRRVNSRQLRPAGSASSGHARGLDRIFVRPCPLTPRLFRACPANLSVRTSGFLSVRCPAIGACNWPLMWDTPFMALTRSGKKRSKTRQEILGIKAANVDDRRRVVLPITCPPNSAVTIQELDDETWIVKRHKLNQNLIFVAIEHIERLPDDPEWEKKEADAAKRLSGRFPPPEF
jgi:hypothetical protein